MTSNGVEKMDTKLVKKFGLTIESFIPLQKRLYGRGDDRLILHVLIIIFMSDSKLTHQKAPLILSLDIMAFVI